MKKIKKRKRCQIYWRLTKISIVLIIVLVVGKNIRVVDAGMNDSVITKNRMDGIYAVANVDGKEHLYYLNMYEMNGRPAYCIELGKDITTDIYHSTSDFSTISLSREQIQYIRALAYYGYQYPGHTSYYYYMATQELIWEYLSNRTINVEWTNVLDVNGPRIGLETYISQISVFKEVYDNDIHLVDLNGNDWIDGQIYSVGEKIILNDTSRLLKLYEVESNGHADVVIDKNTLTIQLNDEYVGKEIIYLKRRKKYDYFSKLYYYDNSQKLISNGNYDEFETEISFYIRGDNLSGQVIDGEFGSNVPQGDASFEGAIYELYNENKELIGTYETDSNGSFLVDNLGYGTYYFKHIQASEGYLLNEDEILFEFNENNTDVKLEQKVMSNIIEIKKCYEVSEGIYQNESNITFQVLDSDGNFYGEMITGENGEASILVPYGLYTIHQDNSMDGYYVVDDFEVIAKEQDGKILHYDLVNTKIKSKVKVILYNKDSGKRLVMGGFSYRIKKRNEDNYFEIDGKDVFQTNENGELIFPMLFPYGDYILELVNVPKGIIFQNEIIEFSISNQTNFEMNESIFVVPINVYYSFIKGKININTNKELFYSELNNYGYRKIQRENISILLIANEDILVNGEIIYQEGDEVYNGVTDNVGFLSIDNLYLGNYCLIDTGINQEQCFSLETNLLDELIVEREFEFTKILDKGSIKVENFSESGDIISGTIFEIYNQDNEKIYSGATNDEGILKVSNLLSGNYCIFQKKIANKYQLNQEEKCIFVEGDKNIEFINYSQKKKIISVPNTFSDSSSWRKLIFMIMIGIGVFIYKKVSLYNSSH